MFIAQVTDPGIAGYAQFGVAGLAIGVGAQLVRFVIRIVTEDRQDLRSLNAWTREQLPALVASSEATIQQLAVRVQELAAELAGRAPPRSRPR